ncbi:hypothetical protein Gotri_004396, partial [Gossypium trilobum]|nr:hypothetical protein [Gossypium trilobum]
MMGRDDIPVGLGDVFAMNQSDNVFPGVGDCKYAKSVPHGSGGFLDSDTLYGLARDLPRSPRSISSNKYAEFNMFLDPLAAKAVFESGLNITLIPLGTQRKETFMGEIIGAIFMGGDHHNLKPTIEEMPIKVIAEGDESMDGQILIDNKQEKSVKVLKNVDTMAYYHLFADQMGDQNQ